VVGTKSTRKQNDTSHGDKRELVVNYVLERILDGGFPGGTRLTTQQLADSLGVSLTPVREALAELAGVGIVDLQPNRGATIHAFSKREIHDVCRVRRALECEAVRGAIGRIPPSQLRKLDQEFQQLTTTPIRGKKQIAHARELDTQLHDLIATHCGNAFLTRELARLTRLFRSLRDASWLDSESRDDCDRLAEEAAEHHAITSAMIAKNRALAVLAMSRHISASARYWSRGNSS
jgi:DNA-binding GntR family transcriptional regulator